MNNVSVPNVSLTPSSSSVVLTGNIREQHELLQKCKGRSLFLYLGAPVLIVLDQSMEVNGILAHLFIPDVDCGFMTSRLFDEALHKACKNIEIISSQPYLWFL